MNPIEGDFKHDSKRKKPNSKNPRNEIALTEKTLKFEHSVKIVQPSIAIVLTKK